MQATQLRQAIEDGNVKVFPSLTPNPSPQGEGSAVCNVADTAVRRRLQPTSNDGGGAVKIVPGNELLETIEQAYSRDGQDETIVITRSNKNANLFNMNIRNRILWREEEISAGDWLLVAKNNYFWTEKVQELDFIANGDLMLVRRIRKHQELYGFRFCDITAYFPDYDVEMDMKILLETLTVDAPGLPKEQNDKLFYTILEDYADLPTKKERMQKMRIDPFYNALQVKYAYAVTCHKAQGGQWKNVFLDLSYVPEEYLGMNFYRWLYTAFTRATGCLYLINPVKEMSSPPK
jgi:exodeoxyribonuclease-5